MGNDFYADPYNDFKKVHKGHLFNKRGGCSPLCANPPKALNLRREIWTTDDKAVTCAKCLAALGVPDAKEEAERRRRRQIEATAEALPRPRLDGQTKGGANG